MGVTLLAWGVIWYLFGFSTRSEPKLGAKMVFHRFFGRVVRVDVFASGTATPIERHLFPWSQPYAQGDPASCAGLLPETWQDWNRDGRWDVWLKNLGAGPDGECRTEYSVDTLGRGKPDWVFVANYGDYRKSREAIVAKRGF